MFAFSPHSLPAQARSTELLDLILTPAARRLQVATMPLRAGRALRYAARHAAILRELHSAAGLCLALAAHLGDVLCLVTDRDMLRLDPGRRAVHVAIALPFRRQCWERHVHESDVRATRLRHALEQAGRDVVAAAAPLAAGHTRSVKIDEADVVDVRDRKRVGAVGEAAAGGKACLRRQWM